MRLSESEFAERFPDHPLARMFAAERPTQKRARHTKIKGAPPPESILEAILAQQMRGDRLAPPVREYLFHETRKWRFDFAWPQEKLAVEVEGGIWNNGRHTRSNGFMADTQKYNMALSMGWRILRFTGPDIRSGAAVKAIGAMLAGAQLPQQAPTTSRRRRPAARAGG